MLFFFYVSSVYSAIHMSLHVWLTTAEELNQYYRRNALKAGECRQRDSGVEWGKSLCCWLLVVAQSLLNRCIYIHWDTIQQFWNAPCAHSGCVWKLKLLVSALPQEAMTSEATFGHEGSSKNHIWTDFSLHCLFEMETEVSFVITNTNFSL